MRVKLSLNQGSLAFGVLDLSNLINHHPMASARLEVSSSSSGKGEYEVRKRACEIAGKGTEHLLLNSEFGERC